MTPEQKKAKELVDKFYDKIEDFDAEHEQTCIRERVIYAKACALICVDEIINEHTQHNAVNWSNQREERIQFWQQVQNEI